MPDCLVPLEQQHQKLSNHDIRPSKPRITKVQRKDIFQILVRLPNMHAAVYDNFKSDMAVTGNSGVIGGCKVCLRS
jgi:hypothetical protein